MHQSQKLLQSNHPFKVSPTRPTAAQLEKINQFTRRRFEADEIYIGQLRLAHNAIDRDGERFSEEVLERFAQTITRKTMLFDHGKFESRKNAIGKFFDVEIEKMTVQAARENLGEDLFLPIGVSEVQVLSPWFYIPVNGIDGRTITKIDAGIYDYASIGFRAEALVPVTGQGGEILFQEYRGTGRQTEATEGSLVYLGAQPGMGVKSSKVKVGESEMENDYSDLLVPGDFKASDDDHHELCLMADCEICNQKSEKKLHKTKTIKESEENLLIPDSQ